MAKLIPACLALAAASLLLPSEPSYDPWAWLVWGRELDLLSLNTEGGPSWKPLPVFFTALFAPLGKLHDGLAPALWLVVARAGGLLALVFAFRLARRLAGPGAAGVGAGAVAAAALALSPAWLRYLGHGNEAPLAVALVLWAVERHLDGARHHAFALAVVACLARPELFPFVALYALWLWRAEPRRQPLIATLLVALPLLWIVPEWAGSGDPLGAGRQARSEPSWSLSRVEQPWLAALERAHAHTGLALELAALAALAAAALRRERAVLVAGAVTLAWAAMYAALTQAGFSGNARYFLPAVPLICILAGVGVARVVQGAARAGPLAAGAAATALMVAATPFALERIGGAARQARDVADLATVQADLARAVAAAGGPEAVVPAGAPTINRAFGSRLAWELRLTLRDVEAGRSRGVVFSSRSRLAQPPPRAPAGAGGGRTLAAVGEWEVLAQQPLFTVFSHSERR